MDRPETEWLFDDLGRMQFVGVDDFTSAEFDGRFVGLVLALEAAPTSSTLEERRFQIAIQPDIARILGEALVAHAVRLGA